MIWAALVALTLVVAGMSYPARYQQLRLVSPIGEPAALRLRFSVSIDEKTYIPLQLSEEDKPALEGLGLSLDLYAFYMTALEVAFFLASAIVGMVIFWRRSDDSMAMITSLCLISAGYFYSPMVSALAKSAPAWRLPGHYVTVLYAGCAIAFCFLFPDGRFVPAWTRFLTYLWIAWMLALPLVPLLNAFNWPFSSFLLFMVILLSLLAFAQVHRYIRVSTPVQRQQTKWVVFGLVGLFLAFLVLNFDLPGLLLPSLRRPGLPHLIYNIVSAPVFYLALLLPPVAISLAILRYRLWDIDALINRTLVYVVITTALGLVYLVSVVLLQAFFRAVTGQTSQLAIVTSTLTIATLFAPLRRGVQLVIDRRFYRRKYDAAKVLAAFSATVRDEVDLNQLTQRLIGVVEETVQPAHVSLWLTRTTDGRRQIADR